MQVDQSQQYAIALVCHVVASDMQTSFQERGFLFDVVRSSSIFESLSESDFKELVSATNESLAKTISAGQDLQSSLRSHLDQYKDINLLDSQRMALVQLVKDIGDIDGLTENEKILIGTIKDALT